LELTGDTSDATSNSSDRFSKKARTVPEITAYINIETPARTAKTKPSVDARSPFFFTLESTHDEFLTALAKTVLPTASIGSINQLKLCWKLNVPANDKQKPLANTSGFRAMTTKLNELLTKNKDTTITLTLPPLLRVALQVRISCRSCTAMLSYSFSLEIRPHMVWMQKWKNLHRGQADPRFVSKRYTLSFTVESG
jgi:hypothetical protein